jgi:adenylate cyclase
VFKPGVIQKKMIEIERKFLVLSNDFINEAFSKKRIVQAYLNSSPERAVRIRIKEDRAFLTIKGKGNDSGTTRLEWETEIRVEEAEKLLLICEEGTIAKTRYEVKVGKHIYEVDIFMGENDGLVMAEIELQSEEEAFEKPAWLGEEVTNDKRYYNAYLSRNPFKKW